ncbi:MAG: tyrosine-protein phosphatase [Ruminococcaceae bacterium]|nr:tyrosine-protein phosphatase [Oscillospiraceae bacterium]
MIYLLKPKDSATVSLASDDQIEFVSEEQRCFRAGLNEKFSFKWNDLQISGDRKENSHPLPVHFEWRDRPLEIGRNHRKIYTFLLISKSEDLSEPLVYVTDRSSFDVYNLELGTKYYWCVQKNLRRSKTYTFTTEMNLPRFIRIGGVSNVRDMGGYPLVTGGRIRQGLMYRGSEFENKMHISPEGIEDIRRLGIKNDLDLRGEARRDVHYPVSTILGLNRIFLRSEAYDCLFNDGEREELYTFFSTFADEKNYPIYYHCRGGADRTGSYAFILGALYGMNYDDLILEYEITSFSIWGPRNRNYGLFVRFINKFMALEGETLSEKARNFIKNYAGLSDEQIDKIYDIAVDRNAK